MNDQFTDLDRTTQSLPGSAQWTYGAHSVASASNAFASLDASSGSLLWDHTTVASMNPQNSFSAIWAHFANAGSPISLAVGETMTLTFDVAFSNGTLSNASTGAFRFALFNSGGSRVTTDFAGSNATGISSGTTFNGWRGYEGQMVVHSGGSTGNFFTRERTGNDAGIFTSTSWQGLSTTATPSPAIANATSYPGTLSVQRTATGVIVQAGMNGFFTPAVLDSSSPFTSFDTVSFFVIDGNTNDVTIDNVNVSVVPEPSSCCLLGAAALGLVRRRRK